MHKYQFKKVLPISSKVRFYSEGAGKIFHLQSSELKSVM
jgi:hypothetical protein